MQLLIGYDGSEFGDAALDELRIAGLPEKLDAVVLTVADVIVPSNLDAAEPWVYPPILAAAETAFNRIEEWVAQAQKTAEKGRDKLALLFPQWSIRAEATADLAADGILQRAETLKPDLIAIGSHGRGAWARLFLGSVSQKIVTHTPFSVRVSRNAREWKDPPHILVGLDGSAQSDRALRRLAEGNWPHGTQARITTVVDERVANFIPHSETNLEEWAQHQVEKAERALEGTGLTVSTTVLSGDPRKLLLKETEEWGADLILVGGNGKRNSRNYLLGSVATALVSHAHCSVEVVR